MCIHLSTHMTESGETGAQVIAMLGGKDLNKDGIIVNLVICGNSRFYDYSWLEDELDKWVDEFVYPDMIIIGGASGVDYLAERWADNQNIPLAVFTEAWSKPRPNSEQDSGRPEAIQTLANEMLEHATHMLAFPGPNSVWTKRMIDIAKTKKIPIKVVELPMD